MDSTEQFGDGINRLIRGQSLTQADTREAVSCLLENTPSDIDQGAFLAAITAKGPTPDEIAGAWQAVYELDTAKVTPKTALPLVDNCNCQRAVSGRLVEVVDKPDIAYESLPRKPPPPGYLEGDKQRLVCTLDEVI